MRTQMDHWVESFKMRKLPVTLSIVGVVTILIIWLWPSAAPSNSANSASLEGNGTSLSGDFSSPGEPQIQSSVPVSNSTWSSHDKANQQLLDSEDSSILNAGFESANTHLASGQIEQAITSYRQLIEDYPMFVEPYINLAAAQAQKGDLDAARATLLQGAHANQSTKILFESFRKLHGALAAQAYRNALETGGEASSEARLPKIRDLSTDFEYAQKLDSLNKLLENEKTKQATLSANSEALAIAQQQLQESKQLLGQLKLSQKDLEEALKLERQKSEVAANQLASFEKQAAEVESDLVAKLRIELANAESALGKANSETKTLIAKNQELSRQVEVAKTELASATVAAAKPIQTAGQTPKVFDQSMKDAAISLIKDWAQAWSNQDVGSYLSFYQSDYTSSSNLSRAQWVDQRRIRLTNKSFINVNVRDFLVIPTANGFSVTFTQHYRSNTLDDTIRKRIDFALGEGQPLSSAKISSEKIVRR